MIPILLQLRTVLAFATIVAATWSVGRIALRRCAPGLAREPHGRMVWECTLGLLTWGMLLTLLGLVGLLFAEGIVALTLVAAAGGVLEVRKSLRAIAPEPDEGFVENDSIPRRLTGLLLSGAAVALFASFLSALAPPLAGDALCYHLELPKRFLADHRLTFFPDNDNSTFPLLAEMWFLWGLAVDGPVAAQLMHWFCGAVLAGAAYVLAVPLVGRACGLGAACLVLLAPGINNQMTAPLNDVALALFTTLALAAWLRTGGARTTDDRDTQSPAWFMLGLMLGGALAVKYTALVFAAVGVIIAIATIARLRASMRGDWIRGAMLAASVAAVVAGPWYVRSAYYRGDPLFPFLSKHGAEGAPSTFPESKTPLGRGVGALVEAPWAMTMEPERFGGRAHQLGPLFLMLVPCLAASAWRRELRPILITAALYGAACGLLRQNVRFLFPLVPLLAIGAAAVLRDVAQWDPIPRRIALAACGAVILFVAMIPAARVRSVAAVALGFESREEFLTRREPTFASAEWINRNLPDTACVLSQEQRAFYYEPTWTRENVYRRRTAYHRPTLESAETLESDLRADGFTHLFLAEKQQADTRGEVAVGYDSTLSTLADAAMAVRPATGPTLVQEWRSEVDGETRRYRLLLLR